MDIASRLLAEQQRMWRRLWNLPRVLEAARDTAVGTTPHDVVLERGPFRLLHYRRQTPAVYAEPVLLCYALINRPYILDLLPDRSVVGRYLERGFDVYLVDWGTPSYADRVLTLDDYVCGFLDEVVRLIVRARARDDLHLLGYCMGGTMSALYTALFPERVKSLTLLAAPIDFGGQKALLGLWSDRDRFDVDAFIDLYGNCPAWFLQACFLWLKPVQSFVDKAAAFYDQVEDPRTLPGYFAMERWINDNIPVAGETFRDFVKHLCQGNELVAGRFHVGPRRADLGRIRCPLLLLTATNDHLVAPPSTEGIRPHVRSTDVRSLSVDAGHVGLVVGGAAQRQLWPEATRWLAERSTPRAEIPNARSGAATYSGVEREKFPPAPA